MAVNVQSQWHDARKLIRLHETKVRFVLAGGLNTVFGLSVYPALYFLLAPLRLHYLIVLGIAQIVCVTLSFLTNKFLVFRTFGNYYRESLRFVLFHLAYFLVNLTVLPVLVEVVGIGPVWGQTLFAVMVIITSYFWHSNVTFASPRTDAK
jgi:putative flippase GtrA